MMTRKRNDIFSEPGTGNADFEIMMGSL